MSRKAVKLDLDGHLPCQITAIKDSMTAIRELDLTCNDYVILNVETWMLPEASAPQNNIECSLQGQNPAKMATQS